MLIILGFGLMITGSTFISHDLISKGGFGLDRLKMMAIALIVAYILVTWIFGCIGIAISINRTTPQFCIALFGTFIFLFVAIPLLAEGVTLRALKSIDDTELDKLCEMPLEQLRDGYGSMVLSFIGFAHRFDKMSETVLNEYMCTETCPCFNYDSMGQGSRNIFQTNPAVDLANYNRTFNRNEKGKKLMYYTSDKSLGFTTFGECYNHYLKRA